MSEQPPPERRREPRRERDKEYENAEDRFGRFFAKALGSFAIIGVTTALALTGFGLVIREIQHQRYVSLLISCRETNERNKNVNARIHEAVSDVPIGPKRVKATEAAKPFRLIITAAVPFTKDCTAYAKSRVGGFF